LADPPHSITKIRACPNLPYANRDSYLCHPSQRDENHTPTLLDCHSHNHRQHRGNEHTPDKPWDEQECYQQSPTAIAKCVVYSAFSASDRGQLYGKSSEFSQTDIEQYP
jgi:hypothetical protein